MPRLCLVGGPSSWPCPGLTPWPGILLCTCQARIKSQGMNTGVTSHLTPHTSHLTLKHECSGTTAEPSVAGLTWGMCWRWGSWVTRWWWGSLHMNTWWRVALQLTERWYSSSRWTSWWWTSTRSPGSPTCGHRTSCAKQEEKSWLQTTGSHMFWSRRLITWRIWMGCWFVMDG